MASPTLTRDQIAAWYFEQLPYAPYPVQEEALLAWFTSEQGVLVCAPTGTGKTLIAEAALFEALQTGKRVYYTTPLIALTDQKFNEFQQLATRWGFYPEDVGLVTGNRRVNPDAPVLVVVAEILLNRLLSADFSFDDVIGVVMDEFHNFNDLERGIVWEFALGLLPKHVRLLLLSATVGNALEFVNWLDREHQRRLELVQGGDRQVPLTFQWVGDMLLNEQLEAMAAGDDESRLTPALVFCFNREQCWTVAEQIKGKRLLADGQQEQLARELERHDWSQGAGPKMKQILIRGIGVHHAGVLPKYRRIVEDLFQRKLLTICVCTETLAAGVNLPARSVVLPNLLKGPPDDKKLVEPSSAHQMFGRAGRPQFDTRGYVIALAHEDDVRIARWREKFDKIPENTKDPGLLKAKKDLKRKMPKRSPNEQYWTEGQFQKLTQAPPGRLRSRGPLPWRLLAYMLQASPEVDRVRALVAKRLSDVRHLESGQKQLEQMLMTLWKAGYVELEPPPPKTTEPNPPPPGAKPAAAATPGLFSQGGSPHVAASLRDAAPPPTAAARQNQAPETPAYRPVYARPTYTLDKLLQLRGINPLYGVFLINQLGIADRCERIQAMESVLEIPRSMLFQLRVPPPDQLPPGPLATTRLDVQLLQLGLASAAELGAATEDEEEDDRDRRTMFPDERVWVLTLGDKLRRLFDYDFPGIRDLRTTPVWAAGELLEFGGDFNKYITSKALQKQEGIVFRHCLRLILLCHEFTQFCPPDADPSEWREDLKDIAEQLAEACRKVDPDSTDKILEEAATVVGQEDDGQEYKG
jgi:superfamily II DNA/RNA helicase